MSDKSCCICLENDDNNLIEYNHCGKYYIHDKCLTNWNPNECIICRKNIINDIESNNIESNNLINNDRNDNYILEKRTHICMIFSFISFSIYLFIYFY